MKRSHFSVTFDLRQAGKKLNIGRNDLSELLRQRNIFQYGTKPFQQYIDRGYFIRKEKIHNGRIDPYTLVTYKGLVWLKKILVEQEAYC
jgi:anti-repressor protein